ncbi:cation diffusion facilitator family transporter [Pelagibacterium limicola]|uniref:cation diffusion facilitator family transporter n=1 Tax=Pelagibacterium limicola TaxID=2791022 RepID=UPI0018AFF213|nr:cation diffusion facilitator family transporter [Pelagibacterium limicola]
MFNTSPVHLAIGSIVVGIAVLALKFWAAQITGSVALLSDALESVVNVVAAFAALIAVRLAARPADATAPYGYHKAEYFSAVLEGIFILIAALLIFHQSWQAIADPQPVDLSGEGIAIVLAATAINGAWCAVLIRMGRKLRSPAIEADGRHLWTDVLSSVGVIVGLGIAIVSGWQILDAIIAVLVGTNILWSGSTLVARSVGGLMDVAVPPEELETIRQTIKKSAEGALEAHDVRTRRAGPVTFIDFHLVVPREMSVETAHGICDRIEAALKTATEGAHVTIHVEPDHKAKHSGIVVL